MCKIYEVQNLKLETMKEIRAARARKRGPLFHTHTPLDLFHPFFPPHHTHTGHTATDRVPISCWCSFFARSAAAAAAAARRRCRVRAHVYETTPLEAPEHGVQFLRTAAEEPQRAAPSHPGEVAMSHHNRGSSMRTTWQRSSSHLCSDDQDWEYQVRAGVCAGDRSVC